MSLSSGGAARPKVASKVKISLRGYEAALIFKAAGFQKVRVMDGGVIMWPFEKIS